MVSYFTWEGFLSLCFGKYVRKVRLGLLSGTKQGNFEECNCNGNCILDFSYNLSIVLLFSYALLLLILLFSGDVCERD